MQLNIETGKAETRLVMADELTIYHASALRDALKSALDGAPAVVVDLEAVSEIDSAGVQLLDAARREAARRDKAFVCVRPSEPVLSVLQILRRTDLIAADAGTVANGGKQKGRKPAKEAGHES